MTILTILKKIRTTFVKVAQELSIPYFIVVHVWKYIFGLSTLEIDAGRESVKICKGKHSLWKDRNKYLNRIASTFTPFDIFQILYLKMIINLSHNWEFPASVCFLILVLFLHFSFKKKPLYCNTYWATWTFLLCFVFLLTSFK